MKILIAAACICIIGVTAVLGLHEYAQMRHQQRLAIQMECYDTWNYKGTDEEKAAFAKLSKSELRKELATVQKCTDYARNGY